MPDKNRFKINNNSKDVQKNIQKNKLTSELSELQTFNNVVFDQVMNQNNGDIIFNELNNKSLKIYFSEIILDENVNFEIKNIGPIVQLIQEYHQDLSAEGKVYDSISLGELMPSIPDIYYVSNNLSFYKYINNEFKLLEKKLIQKNDFDRNFLEIKNGIWKNFSISANDVNDEYVINGSIITPTENIHRSYKIVIPVEINSALDEILNTGKFFVISRGIPFPLLYKGKKYSNYKIYESDFLVDYDEYLSLIENIVSLYDLRLLKQNKESEIINLMVFKMNKNDDDTNLKSFETNINYFNYVEFEKEDELYTASETEA